MKKKTVVVYYACHYCICVQIIICRRKISFALLITFAMQSMRVRCTIDYLPCLFTFHAWYAFTTFPWPEESINVITLLSTLGSYVIRKHVLVCLPCFLGKYCVVYYLISFGHPSIILALHYALVRTLVRVVDFCQRFQ